MRVEGQMGGKDVGSWRERNKWMVLGAVVKMESRRWRGLKNTTPKLDKIYRSVLCPS